MLSLETGASIDPIGFGLRKAAYTPAEAMELIGISRAPFYRFVKEGEIKLARHGTRTLVLAADLVRLLIKMREEGLPSRPKRPGEPARSASEHRAKGA
jgi:excisionase family DNA binding protein